ncbi:hypothetical protein ACS0TY_024262 [Phlomoides rotata]
MAAFRVLYFPPSTSHLCHTHLFPPPLNRRVLSVVIKPQRSKLELNDNSQIRGRSLDLASIESEEEIGVCNNTRLLLQNVPWTCTADDIRPLLENHGSLVDIEFSMYNKTRNRGLAFVTMASHEEAVAALNALDSSEFEGRVLKVNWAVPKKMKPPLPQPKPMPVHNLFVANLHFEARAKDLKELFLADNGKVVSAEVIFRDNPRRSTGYGFVSFNTKADAEEALAAFQGKELMGRPIRVALSKRFLREETKATIQSETTREEA